MNDMRIDYHPTQPKDNGDISDSEYEELWNLALEDKDVVEILFEELTQMTPDEQQEIVFMLFRKGTPAKSDWHEAGRLFYKKGSQAAWEIIGKKISGC